MINFRNLSHVSLSPEGLKAVAEKYAKNLKLREDIDIVFDKRLTKVVGLHSFDDAHGLHLIQISPVLEIYEDTVSFKFKIVSAILHELKHAQQTEQDIFVNTDENVLEVVGINNEVLSEWYSVSETEARAYENKYLHPAVQIYDSESKS